MVNLSFTDRELETLNEYFQSELYKAEQKIDSIKGILSKIGKKQGKAGKDVKSAKKHDRIKTEIKTRMKSKAEKKKPGPKPKRVTADLEKPIDILEIPRKPGRPAKIKTEKIKAEKKKTQSKKSDKQKSAQEVGELLGAIVNSLPQANEANKKVTSKIKKTVAGKATLTKPKAAKAKVVKKPKAKPVAKAKVTAKTKTAAKTKAAPKIKPSKINWQEGVLSIIEDNPQLTASQISESLINMYDLTGDNLVAAPDIVSEQLMALELAGTIMAYGDDGAEPMYGLKPTN